MAGITRVLVGALIGSALGVLSVGAAIYLAHGSESLTQYWLLDLLIIAYFAGWPLGTIGAVAGATSAITCEIRKLDHHGPSSTGL